jgi:hypothetical protein
MMEAQGMVGIVNEGIAGMIGSMREEIAGNGRKNCRE